MRVNDGKWWRILWRMNSKQLRIVTSHGSWFTTANNDDCERSPTICKLVDHQPSFVLYAFSYLEASRWCGSLGGSCPLAWLLCICRGCCFSGGAVTLSRGLWAGFTAPWRFAFFGCGLMMKFHCWLSPLDIVMWASFSLSASADSKQITNGSMNVMIYQSYQAN